MTATQPKPSNFLDSLFGTFTPFFPKRKLLTIPSILNQTKWDAGLYEFPHQPDNIEYFNCGLIRWKGTLWLVTRKRTVNRMASGHNTITLWPLVDNKPTREYELLWHKQFHDEHHEDPRAIIWDGSILLSYCNFRHKSYAHQCISVVRDNFVMSHPVHIRFGKNGSHIMGNKFHEKNWIWFNHDGVLHFSYMMNGHNVCRFENREVRGVHQNKWLALPWKHGEPRGGSPPIRVGDEYIAFFHSSMDCTKYRRRYYMGAVAFEAKPPFKLTRITPMPLLSGSERDPRNMGAPVVVFPEGSTFENNEWHVVGGCNDCRCFWIKIPHEDLMRRMVEV